MMTMAEKIKMYQEKKTFIEGLSVVFEKRPAGSSVTRIDYEVFHKKVYRDDTEYDHFVEFVIVRFDGGGKSVKAVSGNSNTANFRAIGSMLDGGYYDENPYFDSMKEAGYDKVQFSENTFLEKLLSKPMEHISDVRACFYYCRNLEEVKKVIKMIPSVFGTFDVEHLCDPSSGDITFIVTNYYEENGEQQIEEVEYAFWEGNNS